MDYFLNVVFFFVVFLVATLIIFLFGNIDSGMWFIGSVQS